MLCEHTEHPPEPARFEYEYTVHHTTTVRRERLVMTAETARELLSNPLDPDPGSWRARGRPWSRARMRPCARSPRRCRGPASL